VRGREVQKVQSVKVEAKVFTLHAGQRHLPSRKGHNVIRIRRRLKMKNNKERTPQFFIADPRQLDILNLCCLLD
jgi:hypothetical protein